MGKQVYRGCFVMADATAPLRRASDILVEGNFITAIAPAG